MEEKYPMLSSVSNLLHCLTNKN